MSEIPQYILTREERKAAWGLFHTVSLGGGAVLAPIFTAIKYKMDTDEVEASIKDLEQQQTASKDGTTFIISENAYDIAGLGNIRTLTPVEIDTLTTATHAELLEPLYQKRDDLHNNIDGGIVATGIGIGIGFAYLTNALGMGLGTTPLYERAGKALAKRFANNNNKPNKNNTRIMGI